MSEELSIRETMKIIKSTAERLRELLNSDFDDESFMIPDKQVIHNTARLLLACEARKLLSQPILVQIIVTVQ